MPDAPLLLTDVDVAARCTPVLARQAAREALLAAAAGRLVGPPRLHAPAGDGELVVTAGGLTGGVSGLRVYGTFPRRGPAPGHADQLVATWAPDGTLTGLVVGEELGNRRTGALGGVAVDALGRPDAAVLAVLGTGRIAWCQLWAAAGVRGWAEVRVFSPTAQHRDRFVQRARSVLGVPARAEDTAERAVRGADVVLVCTVSPSPALQVDWLAPGCHVSSTGPRTPGGGELPAGLGERADVVVTDSPAQLDAAGAGLAGRTAGHLGGVLDGTVPGRTGSADQLTVYLSIGLAGSEVVLADRLRREWLAATGR